MKYGWTRVVLLFLVSLTPRLGGANENDCIGTPCGNKGRESNSVCIRLLSAISIPMRLLNVEQVEDSHPRRPLSVCLMEASRFSMHLFRVRPMSSMLSSELFPSAKRTESPYCVSNLHHRVLIARNLIAKHLERRSIDARRWVFSREI